MGARGRTSANALGITVLEIPRLQPPSTLTQAERTIWLQTTSTMPADWFRPEHIPVLTDYARHVTRCDLLAAEIERFQPAWLRKTGGPERLDRLLTMARRESAAMLACARSLRLTVQSQRSAGSAGTAARKGGGWTKPWVEDPE